MAATTIRVHEDEVTITELLEAYQEVTDAEEHLDMLKDALKAAKERLKNAQADLRGLFYKLRTQHGDKR